MYSVIWKQFRSHTLKWRIFNMIHLKFKVIWQVIFSQTMKFHYYFLYGQEPLEVWKITLEWKIDVPWVAQHLKIKSTGSCVEKTTFNINTDIQYSQLYGTLEQQINIVKLFSLLEEERKELLERSTPSSPVAADIGPRPSPRLWSLFLVQFVHVVRIRINIYIYSENFTQKISLGKFHSENFIWKISLGKFHSENFTRKISLGKFHSKNFSRKNFTLIIPLGGR